MKRFQFQLESVLNFKQQALDALMVELGELQAQVVAQQKVRAAAQRRFHDYAEEYEEEKAHGLTVVDALKYQGCLDALDRQLRREEAKLQKFSEQAEAKRQEVVAARQGTLSLEKLRDLRLREHDAAAAKEEEKTLDDLTVARRLAEASA